MEVGIAGPGALHPHDLPGHAAIRGPADLAFFEHTFEFKATHDVRILPAPILGQVLGRVEVEAGRQDDRAYVVVSRRFRG